jgi:hypothetical protein
MNKASRHFLTVIAAAGLVLSAAAAASLPGMPSAPTSAGGITPYIIDGTSPGGNRTCEEVGLAFYGDADYYEFSSARVNFDEVFDVDFPTGLTVNTDGTYVSFTSTFFIGAVIVKGGNDANVYVYDPARLHDSGLASPINASGNPAGLSNITFCWNPPDEEPQWCSPGYWRQPHHLWAWAATGISPDELYNDYFTPALVGNPTLLQVLQSPQTYGGRAFNNVGDLLSEAHPDVNFLGERVEDSCPLGREPM